MQTNPDYKLILKYGKWVEKNQYKHPNTKGWLTILFIWLVSWAFIISSCSKIVHAEEYSNEEIANAIYWAEGGEKTNFPYGIKSVKCEGEQECRIICLNTIRKNKIRYLNYGYKLYPDFISFLASRYCPIGAGDDPTNLNVNWIKNVRYFLEHKKGK